MKQAIALIGPGKVGCAISKRLFRAGYPITAVISRDHQRSLAACAFIGCSAQAATTDLQLAGTGQLILLAVPDNAIATMGTRVMTQVGLAEGTGLVHFSGLHPAAIMDSQNSDLALLSLHPLLPFADSGQAFTRLSGCPCALEGNSSGVALGKELVAALGATAFMLSAEHKALYHAAASLSSNYLVTLLGSARDLLVRCGIDQQDALRILGPLLQATLSNTFLLGPEQGLTGPIVRNDDGTVSAHLAALRQVSHDQLELYRILGQRTLQLARAADRLTQEQADSLAALLAGG